MLIGASLLAAAAGAGLNLASFGAHWLILALGALYGAAAFPIYSLCVAHANDLVDKKRAVEVSGGLLLVFSLGAICGPLFASWFMSKLGPGALFLHSAAAHSLIAIVMLARAAMRPELPKDTKEVFVNVPRTTQVVFELDPRSEPVPTAAPSPDRKPDP